VRGSEDNSSFGHYPDNLLGGPCTVKKSLAIFPSPAGMSLTKLSLAGNILPNPSPWKVKPKEI